MDSYEPPSVTEYGDVSELTKGSGDSWEIDAAYYVCGFVLIDIGDDQPEDSPIH